MKVSDADLVEMQERANRVLLNNNASGSARVLAQDLLRVTLLMQKARIGRTQAARRVQRREQEAALFEYLEREFFNGEGS